MSQLRKTYSQAPLPFIGQKRNFIKVFRQVIAKNIGDDGDGWTIIDVFGGSGLLAHNAKKLCPKAKVIYNDFDGYANRLKHIDDTEKLRQLIFNQLSNVPRQKALTTESKEAVIEILCSSDGYVDVHCVASWLLFSGKQVRTLDELLQHTFYNMIRRTPYQPANGYLDGLEIVTESYTKIMPRYSAEPKVLFLLDPPYLHSVQGAYNQEKYFAMIDFLYLMSMTRPPYIFFSSTKSELIDYMDYLKQLDGDDWQRLGNYERLTIEAHLNHQNQYEDNMLYKFN
ncbi:DNA adenine methylase [Acinetobacter sp. c3-l95]|uniref:DNA adenine methylase n=1 Tax=Acinetobacter sp. c3-l95 TaxID=3342804 RepID=UPI0035BA0E61